MEKLASDLMEYIKERDVNILLGEDISKYENIEDLVVVVVNLLDWLKLGYKRHTWKQTRKYVKHKPLISNFDFPWCLLLKNLTENDKRFNKFFRIREREFDFNDIINEEERLMGRKKVFDNYAPCIMH